MNCSTSTRGSIQGFTAPAEMFTCGRRAGEFGEISSQSAHTSLGTESTCTYDYGRRLTRGSSSLRAYILIFTHGGARSDSIYCTLGHRRSSIDKDSEVPFTLNCRRQESKDRPQATTRCPSNRIAHAATITRQMHSSRFVHDASPGGSKSGDIPRDTRGARVPPAREQWPTHPLIPRVRVTRSHPAQCSRTVRGRARDRPGELQSSSTEPSRTRCSC